MTISNFNDLGIEGQLIDNHNSLRQPPRPKKGPTDEETIPLRHHLNPLDEEKVASSYMTTIRYRIAINLFIVGATTILSLTSQGSVIYNPFKPPLIALPMARRKRQVYIQIPHTYKGTETLAHTLGCSNTYPFILATLTLALEALWQAPHR